MKIPEACSLTAPELAGRRAAFARLPLIEDTGTALRFRDEAGVEQTLRDLIRLEAECCPGVRFDLAREEGTLVLAISA